MDSHSIKVGEVARRSGVSIRTLHYYDEIGLLSPRRYGDGEHRLYGAEEVARLQPEIDRGTDPTKEPVLTLARQWQGLIREFTGGDPGIERSLRRMNTDHPEHLERHGFDLDATMMEYVGKAVQVLKEPKNND